MERVRLRPTYYGYITTRPKERKSSESEQERQIEEICPSDTLVYFRDLGVPSKSGLEERPKLYELLKLITRNDWLLVADRSRLNVANLLGYWLEKESKVRGFGLDSGEKEEREKYHDENLFDQIIISFAAHEKQFKSERIKKIKNTISVKRQKGERMGVIPYGYDPSKDGKTLVPNPAQQKIIEKIKKMHQKENSLRTIAANLNDELIESPKGKPWNPMTILNILRRLDKTPYKITKRKKRKRVKVKRQL